MGWSFVAFGLEQGPTSGTIDLVALYFCNRVNYPRYCPPPIQMHYEICKNGILIDINFRLSTRKANTKSTLSTQNATFVGQEDRPITLNLSVVHRTVILRHVTALQRLPSLPCQSPGPSNNNKHNCFKCVRPGRFCTENILSNTNYVSLTTIQKVLEDSVITLWYCVNLDISHSLVGSLLPTYSLASWSTKTFEKLSNLHNIMVWYVYRVSYSYWTVYLEKTTTVLSRRKNTLVVTE